MAEFDWGKAFDTGLSMWGAQKNADREAKAARQAGLVQQQAADKAAAQWQGSGAEQQAALQLGQQQQQATLNPWAQFGQGMMPMAQDAFAQQQALMGQGGADQVMNSPMFQALLAKSQQDIMSNQAARGRMGTGETPMFMQDAALRTGFDVLQGERQASLANTQSLMQPLNLGFGAASQIGQGQFGLGQNMANSMYNTMLGQTGYSTDASAAQAAGIMGASNARSRGVENVLGLGTAGATSGSGGFSFFGGNNGGGYDGGYGGGGVGGVVAKYAPKVLGAINPALGLGAQYFSNKYINDRNKTNVDFETSTISGQHYGSR